jgi:hypothetical protein
MTAVTTKTPRCRAPCGQVVDGEHFEEEDDGCRLSDNVYYACGCRSIVHEYTDGSFQRKVIHHDGTVLVDELVAEHHP